MVQKFVIRCSELGSYLVRIDKIIESEKDSEDNEIFTEYGEAIFGDLKHAKTFDTFTEAKIWAKKLT